MKDIQIPILPVSQQLKGDTSNLREWKLRMRVLLSALMLFGHANGTASPYGQDNYEDAQITKAILLLNMQSLEGFLSNGWDEEAVARTTAAELWKAFDKPQGST